MPMLIFANRISIKDILLMKITRTALLLAIPFWLISCSTQKPLPNYLESVTDTSDKKEVKIPELRIQKNDILSIQVYSAATDPKADEIYNLRTAGVSSGTGQSATGTGFLVDAKGNIEYPRVGLLHAEGLTKQELGDLIKRRINEKDSVLTNPSVIIRFQNLKITVIGEVKSPGVINFPGERVTILEAIGLAGDIDEDGMKDAVKVIREIDGKREIGKVDLSSDSLFQSPYYNLMQNDVVLVQPTRKKAKKAEQDLVLQRVSFGLSLITAIALLYNIFR
jgi:polysaccharide biosynthesis/export protein